MRAKKLLYIKFLQKFYNNEFFYPFFGDNQLPKAPFYIKIIGYENSAPFKVRKDKLFLQGVI
ncbi:MAG: hypothetical protein K2I17_02040, partial [Clostridia bacterium]|nr:hypothetical protein [Clostridia bacterium]